MMQMVKIIFLGISVLLMMSGCVRRTHYIPVENNATINTLYDINNSKARYQLKPEPFSIDSNQEDPEILGPQRTIYALKPTSTQVAIGTIQEPNYIVKMDTLPMTKDECISIIGQVKFDQYSKKFGTEAGAIKRCIILKKLNRG